MAESMQKSGAGATGQQKADPLAAARAARGKRRDYGYALTEADKLCLANLAAAKRACTLASEQIRRGNEVPGEVVRSASILAGATAALLSSD